MSFRPISSKFYGYYQRKAASLAFRKPLLINSQQPLISFTFDDFPQSALLAGGAILNRFGLVGTYYVSLGLQGKREPSGQMFVLRDLATLSEQGHELGSHTYSHCNSWDTETEAFENSVIVNRAALSGLFPGAEFKSFSYPISLPRPLTKARIADYFLSCRGGGQTLNVGKADLNQLAAYFLEQSRDNIQAVKDVIDRNRQVCGWLIFATHDISETPSPYGCTPEFFEHVVQYAVSSGARILPVVQALEVLEAPGCQQASPHPLCVDSRAELSLCRPSSKPLVSILIPAFNAQEWISDTLRSAMAQTWERKEIIVVDDGSTDQTLRIVRQFESDSVRVVSQKNQGAAAARNTALSLSKGEYIQWLDADDLLAPDKIAKQMEALDLSRGRRTLLSSPFGKFTYRWYRAEFVPTALWSDQSSTDWLLRKMAQNLFMQTATWLVSRELTEAAGPWDIRLTENDDDGEYFCRVLLASDGVRFVPEARVYYRVFEDDSLSNIGASDKKREALWLSMQLHIGYLKSLEDSPRSRAACLDYLQRNLFYFYPNMPHITRQAQQMARDLRGLLGVPRLAWWYSALKVLIGWRATKRLALEVRTMRKSVKKNADKALFWMDQQGHTWRLGDRKTGVASSKLLARSQ
jgi:glycosyltransferase involved in cell wall biosynthesis/peptidoglycan/xylan/chitin deacetylase (PgdA/CDA1 family)